VNDALAAQRAGLDPLVYSNVGAIAPDVDAQEITSTLPRDHPAWQRDIISISHRARALIAALRPITVRVLTFWDHHVREIAFGSRSLSVDPSGSYRLRLFVRKFE